MNGKYYQNYEINKNSEFNGFTMRELDKRKLKKNFERIDVNKPNILNSYLNGNMINNKLNEINQNINNMSNLNETKENSKDITEPFLVVLLNEGNTTYIVANLQCLRNIEHIESYYLKKLKVIENNLNNALISYVFSRAIYNLNPQRKDKKKFYSLKSFKKALVHSNKIFNGKSTKNAIDFLIYLLNTLHEEDKRLAHWKNLGMSYDENLKVNTIKYINYISNNEKSIIFDNFCYILETTKTCWECKTINTYVQKYFTFELNFEKALNKTALMYKKEFSIEDCINIHFEKQTIYNVFCEKCEDKRDFTVDLAFNFGPPFFIFILRLNDREDLIEKMRSNDIKIKIDEEIDLYKYVKKNHESCLIYKLNGAIFFDTKKELGYIAYCRNNIDENWYKFEKDTINKVKSSEVLNISKEGILLPVILFYNKIKNKV